MSRPQARSSSYRKKAAAGASSHHHNHGSKAHYVHGGRPAPRWPSRVMDGFVGGPVRLPVATAQGHLLRQLQGRWPGRHGCGAQEAIVRQLQLVVGEQHALRQGHLRLRRVLPPVHQGGCQVTTVIVVPLLNSHRRQLCASFKHIPLCGHVYVCLSCYCVFSFDICHVSMLLC